MVCTNDVVAHTADVGEHTMSPRQEWNRFVKICLLVSALLFGMGVYAVMNISTHREKKPVEVTLINAYSSMQKCGGKSIHSCEVFTGRFRTAGGEVYVREMDGFFYHRYVDEGRKDIQGASITLDDYDQGYSNPWYISWMIGAGVLSLVMLFCLFFIGALAEFDVEDAQRKWEREQEHIARKEKYGY